MSRPLLEVEDLVVGYGPREAVLQGVSFTLAEGEMLGLVGMNGAGKTTLMRALSGGLHPRSGRITFDSRDIGRVGTPELARRGVVVLAEGHRVIGPLTVDENLELATMALRQGRVRARLAEILPTIHDMFPVLKERRKQLAGLLSGGEQQMLSVARAMVQRPRLLMLDEPSLGLAPLIIDRIYSAAEALRSRGISMLIVEQNSDRVAKVCSRLIVLREGRIAAEGSPDQITGERLNAAYFG
jgi:branched-chain amino acid transport system ATP-binding protein